jgi:flagellar hook-associated protein 1 FlgK
VALDGILSSGLSALLTNSAALRVTSENIANVNTPGYHRRVVQQQMLAPGGQLSGVDIASVQRVVSGYIDKEVIDSNASASRYDIQSMLMDQFNAALGSPSDGNSIGSRLDAAYAALGQSSLDPSALASRLSAQSSFASLAETVSSLADSVSTLRNQADQQVSGAVSQVNTLIQQIYAINPQIQHATITGDSASGLLDQRDTLVQQLSQLIGVRTLEQPDGRLFVSTADGVQLVGDNYAQLAYKPSSGSSFNPITIQSVNAQTGQLVGTQRDFDQHATSGQLRGLLDLRDQTLVGIGEEVGQLAQTLSLAFNAAHNASTAVPPPSTMDGRQTGLLATDSLNFTGVTTIGITDSSGALLHKVTVDFNAGTLSVDGGGSSSIGTTIGSFATALNTALGANGTADFSDGVLSLTAAGGSGLVIADDASSPTSRGGVGFSQFFGLNDLFQSTGNAIQTTGLTASDAGGFNAGGAITLFLQGPNGERAGQTTVSVTGTSVGDMVNALNTAFTGKGTFALDANGQLQMTPAAACSGYRLEVSIDTTTRGTTGESFSAIFGLGTAQTMALAQGFSLSAPVAQSAEALAFAKPSLDSTTALGATVTAPGDNRGLLALQAAFNDTHSFTAAGGLPARNVTFADYSAALYQDAASRSATIDSQKAAEDTRSQIAQQAQAAREGVNLDEELSNMMQLQQAYAAGARLLTVSQQLYDQLLQAVGG